MAVARSSDVKTSDFFRVGNLNGDYHVLTIPVDKQGITINVEGTAASATVNCGFDNAGNIDGYENSTIAVGKQLSIQAGADAKVYIIIASSTSSTALRISANTW